MDSKQEVSQIEDATIVGQPEALDIFAEFATDEVAEDSGTWFPYGKTARFLIARSGNRAYQRAMAQAIERRRVDLQSPDKDFAQRVSDEVMTEVIGTALLKGWEGVVYKKKPIPFSVENAMELLKHREFRRFVAACADSVEAFRAKEELEQGEA
jgi:hypothetical protein